jgi:glycosyltransferase involved in cell wall biosynthesis
VISVLFVDHAEAMGGAEHSLLLLFKHLDRQRFDPLLACHGGPLASEATALGVEVAHVPMPRLRGELSAGWRLAQGVGCLAEIIRSHGIDVVHSNVVRSSIYAALAALRTGKPLVWHVRDILSPGLYVQGMGRLSSRTIAISEAVATSLPTWTRATIIPNGVEWATFQVTGDASTRLRQAWHVPADGFAVGMVGRLSRWKGQADFLRAMRLVRDHYPEAHLVLVGGPIFGDKAFEAELVQLAQTLDVAQWTHFLGQRDDLPDVLAALDILVHCSTEPEPFGRVIIEGMAAGLPVAAYGHGAVPEIVLPGKTGLLVRPEDIDALAQAIMALIASPSDRSSFGIAGRQRAQACYDVQSLTERIGAVIESAATGKAAHVG